MKHVPGPHQAVIANYREIMEFLKQEVEMHKEEWNPDDPRDFIDVYLTEMTKVKSCFIYF